jgi:hypothetical protein
MKKIWFLPICAMAALIASPLTANASFWGDIAGKIVNQVSRQVSKNQSRSTKTTTASSDPQKAARHARYAAAMKELENINWVGVAKSSGGMFYFDEDTLAVQSSVKGQRVVRAWMKNTFTAAGMDAVIESSNGKISKNDHLSYSMYEVDYGENRCKIVSGVAYFNDKGEKILTVPAKDALIDVSSAGYDTPTYRKGSLQENAKEKIFERAFPDEAQ